MLFGLHLHAKVTDHHAALLTFAEYQVSTEGMGAHHPDRMTRSVSAFRRDDDKHQQAKQNADHGQCCDELLL